MVSYALPGHGNTGHIYILFLGLVLPHCYTSNHIVIEAADIRLVVVSISFLQDGALLCLEGHSVIRTQCLIKGNDSFVITIMKTKIMIRWRWLLNKSYFDYFIMVAAGVCTMLTVSWPFIRFIF